MTADIGDLYEWDPSKAVANLAKHGVALASTETFDWATALHRIDEAHSDVEPRYISAGFIGDRLHIMVWTPRGGRIRIISLRKANGREVNRYERKTS